MQIQNDRGVGFLTSRLTAVRAELSRLESGEDRYNASATPAMIRSLKRDLFDLEMRLGVAITNRP